jgi:hypothetical protein
VSVDRNGVRQPEEETTTHDSFGSRGEWLGGSRQHSAATLECPFGLGYRDVSPHHGRSSHRVSRSGLRGTFACWRISGRRFHSQMPKAIDHWLVFKAEVSCQATGDPLSGPGVEYRGTTYSVTSRGGQRVNLQHCIIRRDRFE